LIFCISKAQVELLGRSFNNCISYSDIVASTQQNNQDNWFEGHERWILATKELIHGVDCPDVESVISVELPYGHGWWG
jgi:superfamily II DNA or RNA helicase